MRKQWIPGAPLRFFKHLGTRLCLAAVHCKGHNFLILYACAHVVLFQDQKPWSMVWELDKCTSKNVSWPAGSMHDWHTVSYGISLLSNENELLEMWTACHITWFLQHVPAISGCAVMDSVSHPPGVVMGGPQTALMAVMNWTAVSVLNYGYCIPYSRKIWWELYLAKWPPSGQK